MGTIKRLGDAELEIMLAVWGAGEAVTSTYIHEKLTGSRDWALPAVITALNRLIDSSLMTRKQAYRWIQVQLGLPEPEAHIAKFSELRCQKVIELCRALSRAQTRAA